jgi:hypothetical protein
VHLALRFQENQWLAVLVVMPHNHQLVLSAVLALVAIWFGMQVLTMVSNMTEMLTREAAQLTGSANLRCMRSKLIIITTQTKTEISNKLLLNIFKDSI